MLASVPGPVVVDRAEVGDGLVSALVLRCAGEIDSFNAHELAAAVGDGLTGSFPRDAGATSTAEQVLVVDLREVTFLGVSAITALLVGFDRAQIEVAGPRLVVGNAHPVLLVIDALDLRTVFSIHHDVPDALHGRTVLPGPGFR